MTKMLDFSIKITEAYNDHDLAKVVTELTAFIKTVNYDYIDFAKDRLVFKKDSSEEFQST